MVIRDIGHGARYVNLPSFRHRDKSQVSMCISTQQPKLRCAEILQFVIYLYYGLHYCLLLIR